MWVLTVWIRLNVRRAKPAVLTNGFRCSEYITSAKTERQSPIKIIISIQQWYQNVLNISQVFFHFSYKHYKGKKRSGARQQVFKNALCCLKKTINLQLTQFDSHKLTCDLKRCEVIVIILRFSFKSQKCFIQLHGYMSSAFVVSCKMASLISLFFWTFSNIQIFICYCYKSTIKNCIL